MLKSERLLLRDLVLSDEAEVHAYQSQRRFLEHYPWHEREPAQTRQFVRMCVEWSKQVPRIKFQLAAVLRSSGQLVGNCGLRKSAPGDKQAHLGYEFAPRVWGRGLATEAVELLVTWGFQRLALERIVARCVVGNAASIRVLEKSGFALCQRLPSGEGLNGVNWPERLEYARDAS